MFTTVELPLWALLLLVAFAAVTFASNFLFPSVRWFFRRRAERLVARLNTRLKRPIQPFKLARRADTIARLVHDPAVAEAIEAHARAEGEPAQVAFETAGRYAREIVPGFSATVYFQISARLAQWLSRSLYRVRVDGEGALDGIDPEATIVFVLNHRSNMDYVLTTWLAARETALAYAVGEWARRWPLAPLIRAMGGYFVRRRDLNPLYRRVLARYVQIATAEGVTQAVFPEGRLSRDGRLGAPKLGILSYLVDGAAAGGRDVVFVPAAVNYERVLEDSRLVAAETAGPAAFRLRWWMVARYLLRHLQLRLTGRFARFGYAALAFGTPLSLRAHLAGHRDGEDATEALARALMARVAARLPVLPAALAAEALSLGAPDVGAVAAHLDARGAALAARGHPVYGARAAARDRALTALRMFALRGLVRLDGDAVAVTARGRPLIDYYAATLSSVAPAGAGETDSFAKPRQAIG
jgi:glycerol-3-phosphate O-acyltransferase